MQPIFCYSFWRVELWPKKFWRGFCFFLHILFAWACVCILSFHSAHQASLFNISFISNCIFIKLTPEFYVCMPYKASNLQLQTTKCKKFTVTFTLHVGLCHNIYKNLNNCMKLYTHMLHIYLHLWEKFKENVTRRGLSILPVSITLIQYL